MHIKCRETKLMHKNAKRTRNNSKFKHDTHVVACSLYINVLPIQTPSFPSVTPFCLSKHNEKIRYTTNSLLERIVWDAISNILAHRLVWLTQEASSSTVHRPRLNHTCAPVSRGTERFFFATTEISISPPP